MRTASDSGAAVNGSYPVPHIKDRYPVFIPTGDARLDQLVRTVDSVHHAAEHEAVLDLAYRLRELLARHGETSTEQRTLSTALHQLTYAAMHTGGSKRARTLLQKTCEALQRTSDDADSLTVEAHALMAEVIDLDGEPDEAALYYARAAEEMTDLGSVIRSGELHLAAAHAFMDAGLRSQAREQFKLAEGNFSNAADSDHFAQARLASIDLQPDSADRILEQVRTLLPAVTDPLVIGYYHNLRGRQLAMNARAGEALDQLLIAVQTLDTLPSKTLHQAVRLAAYLTNAAYCAKNTGEWHRCIELASRSVVVAEAILSTGDPFVERRVRDGLCTTLEAYPLRAELEEHYGVGVERTKQVLAMRLARSPLDPALVAKNYRNLAAQYQDFGATQADSILKYATLCLQWPARSERSSAHQLRGFALAHLGRNEEALEALAQGLELHVVSGSFRWEELDNTSFVGHVRAAEILDDFARVLEIIESNGHRKNEHLLERFSRHQHDMIDSLFMVEGVDIARLVKVRRAVHERSILSKWPSLNISLASEDRDQVLAWMDDSRSLLFKRERFLMEQDGQVVQRSQLNALRESKEQLLSNGIPETDAVTLRTSLAIDSLQQLLAMVRPTEPPPSRPETELGRRVRAALPQGTALLEYQLTDDEVLIALVRQGDVMLHRFPRTPSFDQALSLFSDPERSNNAVLHITSNTALAPLQALLPAGILDGTLKELIIVPDKELSYVPFEAIPVAAGLSNKQGLFMVDLFNVRYALSARTITEVGPNSSTEEQTVFAFAPNYHGEKVATEVIRSANILLDSAQRDRATPLLHNEEEVEGIQAMVPTSAFTGAAVHEERIKDLLGSGGILHFAMHGYSSSRPMHSGLVMHANMDPKDPVRSAGRISLSNDGVLHAFELLTRAVNSPLVVLSACETGYGTYEKGEGVRSLARSFMLAGARSAVSSLWKVDDRATKDIMVKFYEYLAEGMGKADALAEAKRWYRKENPNAPPSHWAAFILIGDNEPVKLKKRSPVPPWMVAAGLALLAGMGLWYYRRKREGRMAA